MRTFIAAVAAAAIASAALADLTIQAASFESFGYAWTDAGDEYAFAIANSDDFDAADVPGTYAFGSTGAAPGYSSSAGIGVMHAASLRPRAIHLRGQARTYVADDAGYAAVSAWSAATATVRLVVSSPTYLCLTGSLGLVSDYPPDIVSFHLQLTGPAGNTVYSASGTTTVSFRARLDAGTYTLSASASVADSLNHAGGDAYENNLATYDITLVAGTSDKSAAAAAPPASESAR